MANVLTSCWLKAVLPPVQATLSTRFVTVEASTKTEGVREVLDHFGKSQLRLLVKHLRQDPTASAEAWKSPALVPTLVEFKNSPEEEVRAQARMALALLGHAPSLSGRGIRILSLDGGGSR